MLHDEFFGEEYYHFTVISKFIFLFGKRDLGYIKGKTKQIKNQPHQCSLLPVAKELLKEVAVQLSKAKFKFQELYSP